MYTVIFALSWETLRILFTFLLANDAENLNFGRKQQNCKIDKLCE